METTKEVVEILNKFAFHCIKELGIRSDVKVDLLTERDKRYPSAGGYNPNNNQITIVIKNRAIADVLRTLAHELTHMKQKQTIDSFPESDEELQPYEDEANIMSGRLVRFWGREHPEIYSDI